MTDLDERGSGGSAGSPDDELVASLQALLFISEEGLGDERLASAVGRTLEDTRVALEVLQHRLELPGSGIVLREHASGWRLTTSPECASVLETFVVEGHSARLSPAALETLAVVAYQQPVSRGRIAAIRGVAVDGVMRTLVTRGLVEEAGSEASGALLYATTSLFMDKLGVKNLTELPDLAPLLPDIETLDDLDDRPNPAEKVASDGHSPQDARPGLDSEGQGDGGLTTEGDRMTDEENARDSGE